MVHSTRPNKKKVYWHPLAKALAIVSTTVNVPIIHAAPALEEIVVTAQKSGGKPSGYPRRGERL